MTLRQAFVNVHVVERRYPSAAPATWLHLLFHQPTFHAAPLLSRSTYCKFPEFDFAAFQLMARHLLGLLKHSDLLTSTRLMRQSCCVLLLKHCFNRVCFNLLSKEFQQTSIYIMRRTLQTPLAFDAVPKISVGLSFWWCWQIRNIFLDG